MDWDEKFSREHPLNERIKNEDIFLHGTSSKKFLKIQSTGLLKRKVDEKHFSISQQGIYFEKYDKWGTYAGGNAADFVEMTIRAYCETACRADNSSEGIILQINGCELKKLGCHIFADWNKHYAVKRTWDYIPQDVDYDVPVISIVIVDKDIPFESLEVFERFAFKKANKTKKSQVSAMRACKRHNF